MSTEGVADVEIQEFTEVLDQLYEIRGHLKVANHLKMLELVLKYGDEKVNKASEKESVWELDSDSWRRV